MNSLGFAMWATRTDKVAPPVRLVTRRQSAGASPATMAARAGAGAWRRVIAPPHRRGGWTAL